MDEELEKKKKDIKDKLEKELSEYIAEKLNNAIKYTEYLAEKADRDIGWMKNYAENHVPKNREIKRIYSPEDPYGEEIWE